MKYEEIKRRLNSGYYKRLSENDPFYDYDKDTERVLVHTIVDILNEGGMSAKYKGFNLIIDAVRILYRNKFCHVLITKDIYVRLAIMYDVTPYIVEHNIRNAIQHAYAHSLNGKVNHDFYNGFEKRPTNYEFIIMVARIAHDRLDNPQLTLWDI